MNEQEVQLQIQLFDSTGDKELNLGEFLSWYQSADEFKHLHLLDKEKMERISKISLHFKKFDLDQSGKLDPREFSKLHDDLVRMGIVDAGTKAHTLRELDVDGDGKVTFNEYVKWWLKV